MAARPGCASLACEQGGKRFHHSRIKVRAAGGDDIPAAVLAVSAVDSFGEEQVERLPNDLTGAIAEHIPDGFVEQQNTLGLVGTDDGLRKIVEQDRELFAGVVFCDDRLRRRALRFAALVFQSRDGAGVLQLDLGDLFHDAVQVFLAPHQFHLFQPRGQRDRADPRAASLEAVR
jgi:hypothetical protein